MPGSRDHGDKITDKVREELLANLRMLFKQVKTQDINLALESDFTAFLTEIPAEGINVPVPVIDAVVHNPLANWRAMATVQKLPLLDAPPLGKGGEVHFKPVISHEPVLSKEPPRTHGVSFDSMALCESKSWPVSACRSQTSRWIVEPLRPSGVREVTMTRHYTVRVSTLKTKIRAMVKPTTRFYMLPIKKTSIPPNRFSPAARQVFRKSLAEKAKTGPNNIQIRIVYERMHMGLYGSIVQDEYGSLLCTPKAEAVGRTPEINKSDVAIAYLVLGTRLDTQEDIRALVPVSLLEEAV